MWDTVIFYLDLYMNYDKFRLISVNTQFAQKKYLFINFRWIYKFEISGFKVADPDEMHELLDLISDESIGFGYLIPFESITYSELQISECLISTTINMTFWMKFLMWNKLNITINQLKHLNNIKRFAPDNYSRFYYSIKEWKYYDIIDTIKENSVESIDFDEFTFTSIDLSK